MTIGKVGDKDSNENKKQSAKETPGYPQPAPVTIHKCVGISKWLEAGEIEQDSSVDWKWKN